MRLDYVEQKFSCIFANYIGLVVWCPWPFFVLPILLSIFLSVGILRHSDAFIKDELYLYTPTNAIAYKELNQLEQLFYINDSDPYYANRRYDFRRTGYVIVTSGLGNDDGDILNPLSMQAAMHLWSVIQSLTIEDAKSNSQINYPSICVRFPIPTQLLDTLQSYVKTDFVDTTNPTHNSSEFCVSNPLLEAFKLLMLETDGFNSTALINLQNMILQNKTMLNIQNFTETFNLDSLGSINFLGGLSFAEPSNSTIQMDLTDPKNLLKPKITGAKAIMLPYALKHGTRLEDELAEKWELKLAEFLGQFRSPLIQTFWWTYETLAQESTQDRVKLIHMLLPCFLTVSIYTIITCCMGSWILSRPFLALGGVISAAMAISSSVGLLLICGFQITSMAYAMPIIIFAVGVDNVFILLSAWRATNSKLGIKSRMQKTFGDAAVSITITSLTDLVSFGVGCLTPFPSVEPPPSYVQTCTIIDSEITNSTTNPNSISETEPVILDEQMLANILTNRPNASTKEMNSTDQIDQSFKKNHFLAKFFYKNYSNFILNSFCKVSICFGFIAYLGLSIYGCLHLKIGLDTNDLLPEDSYGKQTLKIADKYFSGCNLHLWMYNLSNVENSNDKIFLNILDDEIGMFENTQFTLTADSWLKHFLSVQKLTELDDRADYITSLKAFLAMPQYKRYNKDVLFNEKCDCLEASRVLIRLRNCGAKNQSSAMHFFRHLASASLFSSGVYADFFLFAEQYRTILPGTISSIAMASLAVVSISLIFIPEPLAAIFVALTIVSINIGILGFMSFWSVTIVMSIGFCVDFAAHLAYNFARGRDLSAEQRIRNALYSVGTPILQSASSTIIGVLFMATTSSYIFRSFLKTIILVVGFGVLHGLVFLPVLLTIFVRKSPTAKTQKIKETTNPPIAQGTIDS